MPDSRTSAPPSAHTPGSRTSDYDYALPDALIAQHPIEPRDASRLLVLDRRTGELTHRRFHELTSLIPSSDALVVNTTRVFRARLLGHRDTGGQAEVLLLRPIDDTHFEAMVHPGAKLRPGRMVTITPDFRVEIVETTERRTRVVRLHADGDVRDAIERHGHVPLPPYIGRADETGDAIRYQTVYADQLGSVAAPTAGLHFTPNMLGTLDARGVQRINILLHVGAGTFRPVHDEDPSSHLMHTEWCEVSSDAAAAMNDVRARGGKLWAVGTTSVRALESAVDVNGHIQPMQRETNIFLRPPHTFRGVDHLITNFHTPRSTLIMLVAAFAGYDRTLDAYRSAVAEGYRFYSYGDSMCVL